MIEDLKVFKCFKEVNNANGITRVAKFLDANVTKSEMMDFLDIDKKFIEEYIHELLVRKVIETKKWQDILDIWDIDNVRLCTHCGELMIEGVYADGKCYCSEQCLDKGLGIDKYLELSKEDDEFPEDIEYYYTEW